jgi:hypothetical protein
MRNRIVWVSVNIAILTALPCVARDATAHASSAMTIRASIRDAPQLGLVEKVHGNHTGCLKGLYAPIPSGSPSGWATDGWHQHKGLAAVPCKPLNLRQKPRQRLDLAPGVLRPR